MTILNFKKECEPYKDKFGSIAGHRWNGTNSSQNGVMFTSEYYIQLQYQGLLEYQDKVDFIQYIQDFMVRPGLLKRSPDSMEQDQVDNYHGYLAACKVLDLPDLAEQVLKWGRAHIGFYNNKNPNPDSYIDPETKKIHWKSYLWRQAQLRFMALVASKKARWYHLPLELYTCAVILSSGVKFNFDSFKSFLINGYFKTVDIKADTDARRLSFLLVQTVKNHSRILNKCSQIWYQRLYRDYGPAPMEKVYSIYFNQEHPFARKYLDTSTEIR